MSIPLHERDARHTGRPTRLRADSAGWDILPTVRLEHPDDLIEDLLQAL